HQTPADRRALLQPVAREAIGEEEVRDLRVRAEDGVLVEAVDVIVPGPGAGQLDGFEGRHTLGQERPEALLEEAVVDLEILAVGIRFPLPRRNAADEAFTLWAEI